MTNRFKGFVITLALVLAFSSKLSAQTAVQSGATISPKAKSETAKGQLAKDQIFDPHDLSGVWLLRTPFAGLSQPRGPGRVDDQAPPMTPWGQAKYNDNKPSYGPKAVPPAEGNDVIGNCDPTGFPRNMFSPSRPVQFIQLPNELVQIFQYRSVWRAIWTDGRTLPKDPDPSWYGYSVGKWDGDTFVVNTVGLNEKTWLDHFGYPHSADMRVEERYRRIDHDNVELILTVDDPKTYTMPWVSDKKTFKLAPKQELMEEYCVPSEEQRFNNTMRNAADGKTGQ